MNLNLFHKLEQDASVAWIHHKGEMW
jgi:hypothetical protein